MFLAGDPLKRGNSFQKESNLMVWRETSTAGIQFLRAIGSFKPTEDVLDDTLMKLMQNVRSDGQEHVDIGQLLPERMSYRLDPRLATRAGERSRSVVNLPKCGEDIRQATQCTIGICVISNVSGSDVALGAGPVLAAGHKQLLGVITDVHGEDRVASLSNSVTADNLDAMNTRLDEWLQNHRQACMEEVGVDATAGGLVRDVLEARGWEVREEDLPTPGWLSADVFWEVSDRHVDGVSGLVAKECELGFVRGNDDGYNGCAGLSLLELFLQAPR